MSGNHINLYNIKSQEFNDRLQMYTTSTNLNLSKVHGQGCEWLGQTRITQMYHLLSKETLYCLDSSSYYDLIDQQRTPGKLSFTHQRFTASSIKSSNETNPPLINSTMSEKE